MNQSDSLVIDTGEKRIAINNDPERVIVFNPYDVIFAEKFYRLIDELQKQLTEYKTKSDVLSKNKATDENQIPANMQERLVLMRESCIYLREQIDMLFGAGTSQKVFGDALVLRIDADKPGPFEQFFTGIMPFIQVARAEKVTKYTNPKRPRKRK
jgi:hypothetical protein